MAGIWDIATDPRILDHVQDIIGPDIICWASAILSKKPETRGRCPGTRTPVSGS
jgi:non-heme Fe2+,alpha-ketoglutarate-dependent halogenase